MIFTKGLKIPIQISHQNIPLYGTQLFWSIGIIPLVNLHQNNLCECAKSTKRKYAAMNISSHLSVRLMSTFGRKNKYDFLIYVSICSRLFKIMSNIRQLPLPTIWCALQIELSIVYVVRLPWQSIHNLMRLWHSNSAIMIRPYTDDAIWCIFLSFLLLLRKYTLGPTSSSSTRWITFTIW